MATVKRHATTDHMEVRTDFGAPHSEFEGPYSKDLSLQGPYQDPDRRIFPPRTAGDYILGRIRSNFAK